MIDMVREIIADITGQSIAGITLESSHETVEEWDSLAQVNIMVAVEIEFGIFLSPDELFELNSVCKILRALEDRADT